MDIVEQLRKSANTVYSQDGYTFRLGLHNEAANEIERLRKALTDLDKGINQWVTTYSAIKKTLLKIIADALKEGE